MDQQFLYAYTSLLQEQKNIQSKLDEIKKKVSRLQNEFENASIQRKREIIDDLDKLGNICEELEIFARANLKKAKKLDKKDN